MQISLSFVRLLLLAADLTYILLPPTMPCIMQTDSFQSWVRLYQNRICFGCCVELDYNNCNWNVIKEQTKGVVGQSWKSAVLKIILTSKLVIDLLTVRLRWLYSNAADKFNSKLVALWVLRKSILINNAEMYVHEENKTYVWHVALIVSKRLVRFFC